MTKLTVFLAGLLMVGCVTTNEVVTAYMPSVGSNIEEIKEYYKANTTVIFTTNFKDEAEKKIRLSPEHSPQIDSSEGRYIVSGIDIPGGGLVVAPRRIERNTRCLFEFIPYDESKFQISLEEPVNDEPADGIYISQFDGIVEIIQVPWTKKGIHYEPDFYNKPWLKREFSYISGRKYLAVFTLSIDGILEVRLINEKGKENVYIYNKQFKDVPMTFMIRNFAGKSEYLGMDILMLE